MEALGAARSKIWRHWVQLGSLKKTLKTRYGGTGCSSIQNMEALGATRQNKKANMEALGATVILKITKNQPLKF
jgi:hypothetical protein